jgi:drug/metabolite transporter (DMT)-like permease
MNHSVERVPIALCVLGMVLVGSSVSVSQLLLEYPMLTGQAIRYAVACPALFAIARLLPRFGTGRTPRVRPTAREIGILSALAATGMAAFNACVMVGLRHADPAVVGTVIGAAPLGLALLAPALRGVRPSARLVAAAAVVVGGTALVEGAGRADLLGLLAAAGALAGEVAFSLLAAAVLPSLGAVRVAAWSSALAVPLLLAGALAAGEWAALRWPSPTEIGALAYLAGLMTVAAFVVWFIGLQRLGVERAGMIVGVMPVATLTTAAIMAGELPRPGQALGVLTVAAGLALGLTAGSPRLAAVADRRPDDGVLRPGSEPGQATAG